MSESNDGGLFLADSPPLFVWQSGDLDLDSRLNPILGQGKAGKVVIEIRMRKLKRDGTPGIIFLLSFAMNKGNFGQIKYKQDQMAETRLRVDTWLWSIDPDDML